jgi:hypothetical protein
MFIKEISEKQADLIKSFAIFYLLLVVNYVGDSIFTCDQVEHLKRNKWIQLVISFLLFYFLVTLVSDTGKLEFTPPIEKLVYSLFYFLAFLIVMRLDLRVSILVLILIFTIYFLELNKEFYLDNAEKVKTQKDKHIYDSNKYWITFDWPFKIRLFKVDERHFQTINRVETIIFYSILVLLVVGFIAYGGEIHDTVRRNKNLTWLDVIVDTNICKLKNRQSFLHYLKVGLGIKV